MKINNFLDKLYIKFLFPKLAILKNVGLTRYGSDYGGWAIPKGFLNSKSIVYSFGAGEDISFDISLAEANQCEVNIFDPTPKAISHFKNAILDLETSLSKLLKYQAIGVFNKDKLVKFYTPQNENHVSHSITNIQKTENFIEVEVQTINTILKNLNHTKIDLIKLDIEGAEYPVITDMIENKIDFNVLCVEYHAPVYKMDKSIKMLLNAGYGIADQSDFWNYTFIKLN
jgi:FkbM family methyltransferase